MWADSPHTEAVSTYIKTRTEEFELKDADKQAAIREWDSRRRTTAWHAALFGVGGWVVLSVAQAIIGWVVRGFAGIPWGQDRRTEPPEP